MGDEGGDGAAVLAQLRGQLAELTTAVGQLRNENVHLNNTVQQLQQRQAAPPPPPPPPPVAPAPQTEVLNRLVEVLTEQTRQLGRRERPQLVDQRSIGKPTIFAGDESRFHEWAKKLEDYLCAVEPLLGRALEWALDQEGTFTTDDVELFFGGADENFIDEISGLNTQIKSVLASATEAEAWTIVQAAPKNGLLAWQQLHRRFDSMSGGRRRTLLRAILAPSRVKVEELGTALQTWEGMVTAYNKKAQKLQEAQIADDFLASALESMVPEELERHLQLNASRLRRYADMRTEVVQYYEQRTGKALKISVRDRMPTSADHGGVRPMDVDALVWKGGQPKGKKGDSKGKKGDSKGKKGQRFAGYCNKCGKYGHKAADCWGTPAEPQAKTPDKGDWKVGQGKGKGKGKGKDKGGKGKKGDWWKGRPAGSLDEGGGEIGEPEQEHGALDMGSLDQGRIPPEHRPGGWVKMNLDSGAAVTAFPEAWVDESTEDPNHKGYITASGEKIADYGELTLKCTDENEMRRKISGRVSQVHKVLASASQVARAGQMMLLEQGGGYVIPRDGTIGKMLKAELARAIRMYGDHTLLPVYEERGVYNFYLKVDGDENEASALGSPEQRVAPQPGDFQRLESRP